MDMSQYRELFFSETREHLHTFNELIVALENDADDREKIDSLFRTAHSIKGMAASMGFGTIAELSHRIEDLMDKVRKKVFPFDQSIADMLLEGADLLEGLVNDEDSGQAQQRDLTEFLQRLADYSPDKDNVSVPAPQPDMRAGMPSQVATERAQDLAQSRKTVRVRTEILDNLINITGELITNKHRLVNVSKIAGAGVVSEAIEELSRLLRSLHNEVLNVRMMPFSTITDRFPRIVRDLARKGNKEINFEITGKEIEVDRGILEDLADPLVHILRNAVDHGLEAEADRVACGKDARGMLQLVARRDKDQLIVTVTDDGKGMNPAVLIASALEKGIITQEAARLLSQRDALLLTCRPGFSTAREVTDVSGRGVGMDIVRSTIQSLGGTLAIDSEPGRGTSITLKLPLTIAIINVLLISCGGTTFAVPVTAILRTMEIRREEIVARGNHKVFYLDEEPVPILSMSRIFGLPSPSLTRMVPLLVSEVRGRKAALAVDQFLGHQEVFVKPLGLPLGRLKGLIGGAIIGNGEVVLILDMANIL